MVFLDLVLSLRDVESLVVASEVDTAHGPTDFAAD